MAIPQTAQNAYELAVNLANSWLTTPEGGTLLLTPKLAINAIFAARAALLAVRGQDPVLVDQELATLKELEFAIYERVAGYGDGVVSTGEIVQNIPVVVPAPPIKIIVDPIIDPPIDIIDRPVVTIDITQAITVPVPGPIPAPPPPRVRVQANTGNDDFTLVEIAKPITVIGVGDNKPDNVVINRNETNIEIDNIFNKNKLVTPQANVLDQYASYTYNASVYLMKPTDYAKMMKEKKKQLYGAQLLFQSGGSTVNTINDQPGRNKFFKTDYYIDQFSIKSVIHGKGTNAAHNANMFTMTVIEPYGITFLANIKKAVNEFLGTSNGKDNSFLSQIYILVIRFYGYDQNGNLVRGGIPGAGLDFSEGNNVTVGPNSPREADAIIEKFYPFNMSNVEFKIANKTVEYEIQATTPATQIAASVARGTIPYGMELSAVTLAQALSGTTEIRSTTTEAGTLQQEANDLILAYGGTLPPPNATAAPTPIKTIRRGLMDALNQQQLELVKAGRIKYADHYSIEFLNPAIANALVKPPGSIDKTRAAMICGPNDVYNFDPRTQSMSLTAADLTFTAGEQLVSVLDRIVRNSSYIKDQENIMIDPQDGVETRRPKRTGGNAGSLSWYKIGLKAVPIGDELDPERHDYAYDITYTLSFYRVEELASDYFQNDLDFGGVHKSYNYWFTGQNTSVISYENKIDALYLYSMGSINPKFAGGQANITNANEMNALVKRNPQPRSNESSFGARGRANEPPANAAAELYTPGSWAHATLVIVGDPAWLQQGEASVGLARSVFFDAFLPDGTINYESRQILFEIAFNTPVDYNYSTGLMDVGENNYGVDPLIGRVPGEAGPGRAAQNFVYIANEVTSDFKQGKFTQTLKGTALVLNHTSKTAATIANNKEAADLRLALAENARVGATSTTVAAGVNTTVSASLGDVRKSDNIIVSTAATPSTAAQPKPPTSFGQFIGAASSQLQNTLAQEILSASRAAGNVVTKSVTDAINAATSTQIVNNPPQIMAATDDAYNQVDPNARENNTDLIQADGAGAQDTQSITLNENTDIGGL